MLVHQSAKHTSKLQVNLAKIRIYKADGKLSSIKLHTVKKNVKNNHDFPDKCKLTYNTHILGQKWIEIWKFWFHPTWNHKTN